ncbi:MAG: EAL domain-containing protein, partial [Elusimicrobiota bacterium]
ADCAPAQWMRRLDALPRISVPSAARICLEEHKSLLRIMSRRINMLLQEIVSLQTRSLVAFEALARGPADGPWHSPDQLFEAAARCGLREKLELGCLDSALCCVRGLPAPLRLAVNLSADLFDAPAVQWLSQVPGLPQRLILEITEHVPVASPETFLEETRSLRLKGAKLALDDVGCGYLNMDLVRALKPDIVKLCITLTRRMTRGREVLDVIAKTVDSIRAQGAEVLIEGVENEAQARLARQCGVDLAQGFYFAKPREAAEVFKALRSPDPKTEHAFA